MESNENNKQNTNNTWWNALRSLLWGILFFVCLLGIASLVGKCVFNNKINDIRHEHEERRRAKLEYEQAEEERNARWREEARISDSIRAARDSINAANREIHPEKVEPAKVNPKTQPKSTYRSSRRNGSYSYSYSGSTRHGSYDDEDDDDDDTWYHDEDDADEKYEYDYWE